MGGWGRGHGTLGYVTGVWNLKTAYLLSRQIKIRVPARWTMGVAVHRNKTKQKIHLTRWLRTTVSQKYYDQKRYSPFCVHKSKSLIIIWIHVWSSKENTREVQCGTSPIVQIPLSKFVILAFKALLLSPNSEMTNKYNTYICHFHKKAENCIQLFFNARSWEIKHIVYRTVGGGGDGLGSIQQHSTVHHSFPQTWQTPERKVGLHAASC